MRRTIAVLAVAALLGHAALAQQFNWKKHQGETITFLSSNHPWANAVLRHKGEFEALTGITLKFDTYQEQQMRQRLVTVMNAKSPEIDVFMSLPSREGEQFAKAGWYADLTPFVKNAAAKDYDFADFNSPLLAPLMHGGKLTGIPLNIEAPVIFYRKDVFSKCGVTLPARLTDLPAMAAKLKACNPGMVPWTTRGLKAALPYTYAGFLHNLGGDYLDKNRKPALCSKEAQEATALYARLLKDYGPLGAINNNFYQNVSLYHEGKAAMAFDASNELHRMVEGGAWLQQTGVALLPPGMRNQPVLIGWGLSVSAHSRRPEAAWYFVQWVTSPAMQAKLALEDIAPPRAKLANDSAFKKWIDAEAVRREWMSAIQQAAKIGSGEVGVPIIANVASRDIIGGMVNDVMLGQKTVGQACTDANKALAELMARE
jgi:multiple sugar transport system substrate-binding protein